MTESDGSYSVFEPCQQNQINFSVGWAVVWLVAFGEGCDGKGRLEDAVVVGTTRAGEGGFARFAPKPHEKLHVESTELGEGRAFFAYFSSDATRLLHSQKVGRRRHKKIKT